MFGVVPKTLWEKAYGTPDSRNRIPMAAKVLCLQGAGRTILVDTGNSPYMPDKLVDIYGLDFREYSLEHSLAKKGLKPEDITDVILTHLHFDHVGGAMLSGESPRFPNARHYVQKAQHTWALNPTEKDRASFFPSMFEPLREAGMLELLDGSGEILDGVFVHTLFGHSQAMQAVRVTDGQHTLFYPADLIPTAAHVPVPYVMGYDNFPLTTIDEKKALADTMVDEQWIVVFEHDAHIDASRVERTDRGLRSMEPIQLCV